MLKFIIKIKSSRKFMKNKELINSFEKYIKLADEHYQNGNFESALDYYKKYLEKDPQNAVIHNIVGYIYKKINAYENLDEQIKHFEKALELKPDYEVAIRNLAFAHTRAAQHQKALEYFEKLLGLNPLPDDYSAYACLKICLGDFEDGWKYYEYRFLKNFGRTFYPEINKPRWDGQEIKDKTLLIHYEQGFGDTIQFFRYLEQVKPLVKNIIFLVQKEMLDLIKHNDGQIQVINESISLKEIEFDYHIPLLSLPLVLKATKQNIPFAEGYINADKEKIQLYKKTFFNNNKFKIGISWQGATTGNARRDVPLQFFYSLGKLKNVQLYSLQKSYCSGQFDNLPSDFNIINLGKDFKDFSDTAAAMANLDLFITSDNSVFNLAGAMGKETFVLLNKDSEWRWFLDEETTPWYKNVKIFKKQDENESWSIQMEKIINTLSKKGF